MLARNQFGRLLQGITEEKYNFYIYCRLVNGTIIQFRAAPIQKFPQIQIPGYSQILILQIPQIADTFADTDTFGYFNL